MSGEYSVGPVGGLTPDPSRTQMVSAANNNSSSSGNGAATPATDSAAPGNSADVSRNSMNMTVYFDSQIGRTVIQLHDFKGNVILSMPSLKALDAYNNTALLTQMTESQTSLDA